MRPLSCGYAGACQKTVRVRSPWWAHARPAAPAARARASLRSDLAGKGIVIISGGAFGIDAAAHEGALAAAAAPTFAVLGCGVDVTYPDRHGPLFARIVATGGLLSEYAPGTPPRAGQFPARNRIIAALGDAVIVVEAAYRSGALITAALARSLGRPVLAVPGSSGTACTAAKAAGFAGHLGRRRRGSAGRSSARGLGRG